jgi:hypothetical protein
MQQLPDHVAGVDIPNTELTQSAWSVLRAFAPRRLVNHSMRTFLWAGHLGGGVPHNSENLLIACLLHDIGLTDAFDHHRLPFELASAHVTEVFLAGAGWSGPCRATVTEAIRSHIEDDAPVSAEAELIRIGVGVDVSGRRFGDVEPGFATAVLAGKFHALALTPTSSR